MWKRAYNRHVKSVMKSGIPARAEVLSAEEFVSKGVWLGSGVHETEMEFVVSRPWNMHLQVVPEDRPPFELEVKMEIPLAMIPVRGMTLQVIYDPDEPQSIVVDPASVPKDLKDSLTAYAIDSTRAMGGDTTGMQEAADAATDPMAAASAAAAAARRNQMEKNDAMLAEIDRARAEGGEEGAAAVAAQKEAVFAQLNSQLGEVAAANPGDQAIAALVRAQREAVQVAMASPPPSPSPAATDAAIEAKLAQLDALKAAGAMDEHTYSASRQRLIDALLK